MDEETFTQTLSRETINKLFAFYSGMDIDTDELRANLMVFVNEFIQLAITHALQDFNPKESKKKRLETVHSNFVRLKEVVEEEIPKAFMAAIMKNAGQKIQYYCVVSTSQGPLNGYPC